MESAPCQFSGKSGIDLLAAFVPLSVVSEITSKCNLRCRYCSKSFEHLNSLPGRDEDMAADTFTKYLTLLRKYKFDYISFCGTGEFTFRPGWTEDLKAIRDATSSKLGCVSNFGRLLSAEELDVMLDMFSITVSVDTTDAELLREIRKAVDFRIISTNVMNLKKRSIVRNVRMPAVTINATIYRENLTHIFDTACWAAAIGANCFQLARMGLGEDVDFPQVVSRASKNEAQEGIRQIDVARSTLNQLGVEFRVFGDLSQELAEIADA